MCCAHSAELRCGVPEMLLLAFFPLWGPPWPQLWGEARARALGWRASHCGEHTSQLLSGPFPAPTSAHVSERKCGHCLPDLRAQRPRSNGLSRKLVQQRPRERDPPGLSGKFLGQNAFKGSLAGNTKEKARGKNEFGVLGQSIPNHSTLGSPQTMKLPGLG